MGKIAESIKKYFTHSIQRQLVLGIVIVFTILSIIFISGLISSQYIFLSRQSIEHTESLAQSLAANSVSWILADDVIGLEEVILTQKSYSHIKYAMILSLRGRVIAHTETNLVGLFIQDPISISLLTDKPEIKHLVNNFNLLDIAVPIFTGESHIGWARVAIFQDSLQSGLNKILITGILFTLFSIFIAALIAALMARGITNGIGKILVVTQKVEQGELDITVASDRPDELGQLGKSFNKMIVRIKKSIDELDNYKNNLEVLVVKRTNDLLTSNSLLESKMLEQNETEKKLLLNQYYLKKAQEMGSIGTWELDLENNHLTWTDESYKIFGLTRTNIELKYETFISCVYPDDRVFVTESWNNALKDNSYDIEHRVISDGNIIWVREKANINYDADGKPLMAIGFVQDITERKKAEHEIKHQLEEKEIILKEVNHRIKNNFASISSLLSMQADSISHPEALSALQDAIGRVNSMYVLYENLLLSDNYEFTSVKVYLENLIDSIISIFPPDLNIKVEKNIDDFDLDPQRLIPVGIIVNELLTNTMKYAFEGRGSGIIQCTITENDKQVTLIIQDNGKGLPEGFDINEQTGFGLMLVNMLSEQLLAVLTVESHDGVRSTLEFSI